MISIEKPLSASKNWHETEKIDGQPLNQEILVLNVENIDKNSKTVAHKDDLDGSLQNIPFRY